MKIKPALGLFSCCLLPSAFCLPAAAQGTAFTYQGRLNSGGASANGSYDIAFPLFATNAGGVASLPVSRWNYKEDNTQSHIGPMAQDFHAAFDVGPDDKHIAAVDEGGVALAAIPGLSQKLEEQRTELNQKESEIVMLKQRLDALEKIIRDQKSD